MARIAIPILYFGSLVALLTVALKLLLLCNSYEYSIMGTKLTNNAIPLSEENIIGEYGVYGGLVIGIDLGVAYSRAGYFRGENFEIIPDWQGRVRTPSYVSFLGGMVLVGESARALENNNPFSTVHNIRNLVGRRPDNIRFQQYAKESSVNLIEQDGVFALQLQIDGKPKVLAAERILAYLIQKLKRDAELYLDEPVKYAIATVPVYFDDLQREYVKQAGLLAGIEFLRLMNEPTASGIAKGIEEDMYSSDEGKVVFFDINDATCDITVSLVEQGIYEILSNTSVSAESKDNISGKDFDSALLDHVVSVYALQEGNDIEKDLGAMGKLRFEVDVAEDKLFADNPAIITIQPRRNTTEFTISITPTEYQEINKSVFIKTLPTFMKALEEAKLEFSEIDALVITGDPRRVAKAKPFFMKLFDGKPVIDLVPSDEAFVRGAAKIGQVLSEPIGGNFLCCLDVNPLSLGIEVEGELFHKVIRRNTVIPTRKSINVTTVAKDQSRLVLRIIEGERLFAKDNKLVGIIELDVTGIEGPPDFEVSFELDTDRSLKVVLNERKTGREQTFVDTDRARIDYAEVEKMIMEAEEKLDEDEVAKGAVMKSIELHEGSLVSFGLKVCEEY